MGISFLIISPISNSFISHITSHSNSHLKIFQDCHFSVETDKLYKICRKPRLQQNLCNLWRFHLRTLRGCKTSTVCTTYMEVAILQPLQMVQEIVSCGIHLICALSLRQSFLYIRWLCICGCV